MLMASRFWVEIGLGWGGFWQWMWMVVARGGRERERDTGGSIKNLKKMKKYLNESGKKIEPLILGVW